MKRIILITTFLLMTSLSYGQIPQGTRSIRVTNNRETYYGNKGYLGNSVVRNNKRIYSDRNGVISRQYIDGAGTTRFIQVRPQTYGNYKGAVAGEPARSAASRGFK